MLDSSIVFFLDSNWAWSKHSQVSTLAGCFGWRSRQPFATCKLSSKWTHNSDDSMIVLSEEKCSFSPLGNLIGNGPGWLYKNGSCGKPQKWVTPCYPPKSWDPPSPVVFSWSPGEGSDGASGGGSATCWGCGFTLTSPGFVQGCSRWCGWFSQGEHFSWEHVREHPLESLEIGNIFCNPYDNPIRWWLRMVPDLGFTYEVKAP